MQLLIEELQRVDGRPPGSGLAKHAKMAASPFVFLRGSAQLFYADLAQGTLRLPADLYRLPLTTVMGDCHVSNFGFLTEEGSHGDRVIFAPNDFDDACFGHAAWDLARFAVSLILCADHCRGLISGEYPGDGAGRHKPVVSGQQADQALRCFLQAYTETCDTDLETREHHAWVLRDFARKHVLAKRYRKALARAYGGKDFTRKSALAKVVEIDARPLRFRERPQRLQRLSTTEYQDIEWHLSPYMDDKILDIVERLGAGTGSLNMRRYYLLVGPQELQEERDLFLCHVVEVKQQRSAAPLQHFPGLSPINRLNPAHLTVVCQRRMQRDPDLLLDELVWRDSHWLIRSRHHARVGIDPLHVASGKRAAYREGFEQYARTCGRALALTHARGDRRSTLFEQAVHEILPGVTEDLLRSLTDYARIITEDCARLAKLERKKAKSAHRGG
jgi:uncharacterized protein (DUF2252 family)